MTSIATLARTFRSFPGPTFEVSQDHNAGLGKVWCHVFVTLDSHHAHGRDGFGHGLWEAAEAAILLEVNLHVGVVFEEPVLFFVVGVQPR